MPLDKMTWQSTDEVDKYLAENQASIDFLQKILETQLSKVFDFKTVKDAYFKTHRDYPPDAKIQTNITFDRFSDMIVTILPPLVDKYVRNTMLKTGFKIEDAFYYTVRLPGTTKLYHKYQAAIYCLMSGIRPDFLYRVALSRSDRNDFGALYRLAKLAEHFDMVIPQEARKAGTVISSINMYKQPGIVFDTNLFTELSRDHFEATIRQLKVRMEAKQVAANVGAGDAGGGAGAGPEIKFGAEAKAREEAVNHLQNSAQTGPGVNPTPDTEGNHRHKRQ